MIGGLNNGWRVAMTTLGNERGGRATIQHLAYEKEFWDLVDTVRKHGKEEDALTRQRLAWAFTNVELMRYSGLRLLAALASQKEPGPEASVSKLFWSEYHKRFGELAVDVLGPEAMAAPRGRGLSDLALAGRVPVVAGRDHLLGNERDTEEDHRRASPRATQRARHLVGTPRPRRRGCGPGHQHSGAGWSAVGGDREVRGSGAAALSSSRRDSILSSRDRSWNSCPSCSWRPTVRDGVGQRLSQFGNGRRLQWPHDTSPVVGGRRGAVGWQDRRIGGYPGVGFFLTGPGGEDHAPPATGPGTRLRGCGPRLHTEGQPWNRPRQTAPH